MGLACSRNTTTGDTAVAQATKKGNHFPVGKASVDWVQSHGHRAPSPARKWETDVLGDGLFGESTTASLARHDPADATMLGSTSVTMSLMRRLAEGRSVVPTPPMAANGMRSPPGRQYENGLGGGGIRPRTTGGRAGTTRTTLWTKQGKPPAVDLTGDGCVEENPGPRDPAARPMRPLVPHAELRKGDSSAWKTTYSGSLGAVWARDLCFEGPLLRHHRPTLWHPHP